MHVGRRLAGDGGVGRTVAVEEVDHERAQVRARLRRAQDVDAGGHAQQGNGRAPHKGERLPRDAPAPQRDEHQPEHGHERDDPAHVVTQRRSPVGDDDHRQHRGGQQQRVAPTGRVLDVDARRDHRAGGQRREAGVAEAEEPGRGV